MLYFRIHDRRRFTTAYLRLHRPLAILRYLRRFWHERADWSFSVGRK